MSRATMGGTRIPTKPTRNVPGGMADPGRTNFNQLMGRQRPAWADDPTLDLPCQRPDSDPDWWFETGVSAENRAIREHARQLCLGCPMRYPCRDQARANHEGWGMWGAELMEPLNRPGSAARRKGANP
jgi:Transcription factor WhiB